MMDYELLIRHEDTLYYPPIADSVQVEWERRGQPGKMTFSVIKTEALKFVEGDACRFSINGSVFFYGFVFEKTRIGSAPHTIKVTAYDQLFYLRNKDYFQYSDKTAAQVVQMLAEDFGLRVGVLADTGYRIPSRTEDDKTLFDIIQNALDETTKAVKKVYVLYDDAGKLMLTDIGDMKIDMLVDRDSAGDYDYKTGISTDTYNKIRLFREGESPTVVRDGDTIEKWGVLQYVEKVSDVDVNLSVMAQALLELYNRPNRTLTLKNVLGDTRVRAGTLLPVILDLEDMSISNYMLVEQVKHTFSDGEHLMELKIRGNDFVT